MMDNRILELRDQGLGYLRISKILGIKKDHVRYVCRKNNVDGYTKKPELKTHDEISAFINERLPGFKYIDNYSGADGSADIQCNQCGTVMTRSMISIRHSKVKCRECERIERVKAEELKRKDKEAREAKRELEREEKKKERFWSQPFNQISMKQCPVCRAFFMGNKTYCSDRCREQNKWHMKEGYRNLFPLDKVYERDGGVCYLCGKTCDWNDVTVRDGVLIYGNNYPSRDHVIPKSKGGMNDWSNIRLAHRICNSLKSDSPLVEKK